ncbi:MAG TPA: DUF92 domain-containing protein [Candidatus Thermoplasmatota archaeon]|nr:DUF92 domain-containing protein [Candidatus Thermoplasmatota archaeon]
MQFSDLIAFFSPRAWKTLQLALVVAIGVYTYRRRMLNAAGAFTAVACGAAIVLATSIVWLVLLFALLAIGSAATRFHYSEKEARKVAEKAGGRRRTRNVLANGLPATIVAILVPFLSGSLGYTPLAVAYVSAVAVAASDTLASEFGSLAKRVYLITTLRRVPAGTDGGFSAVGQAAAVAGALALAVLGWLFLGYIPEVFGLVPWMEVRPLTLLIPTLAGFFGCQVDSVLGATLEGEGLLTKEEVNGLSIAAGAILGLLLAVLWL